MPNYFTKDMRALPGRTITDPAELWALATPGQRADWGLTPPPASGPAWTDGPAPGDLATAMAAGKAAVAAGYGPRLRRDGRAPCGHCTRCDYGQFEQCHRPLERAEARLKSLQAAADRIDDADAASLEVQKVVFLEEQRRGLAF